MIFDNYYNFTEFQSTRSSQTSTTLPARPITRRFYFNPRGLRRPRPSSSRRMSASSVISIHEVFADLDFGLGGLVRHCTISIHEVFADLDLRELFALRQPYISIHEVFADLDPSRWWCPCRTLYFNPRGLRRPRLFRRAIFATPAGNFNPRGLRRPRRAGACPFRAHKEDFNPRGLRRPRP